MYITSFLVIFVADCFRSCWYKIGQIWSLLVVQGNIWSGLILVVFAQFLTTFNHFWSVLNVFNYFWSLTSFGRFCSTLISFGHLIMLGFSYFRYRFFWSFNVFCKQKRKTSYPPTRMCRKTTEFAKKPGRLLCSSLSPDFWFSSEIIEIFVCCWAFMISTVRIIFGELWSDWVIYDHFWSGKVIWSIAIENIWFSPFWSMVVTLGQLWSSYRLALNRFGWFSFVLFRRILVSFGHIQLPLLFIPDSPCFCPFW